MSITTNTASASQIVDQNAHPRLLAAHASTEASEWDAFVTAHSQGTFYHRYAWKDINDSELGHQSFYLEVRNSSGISGILPLVFIRSRIFGRILCSMPFVNFGGPCCADRESLHVLLKEAIRVAGELRADYLELRSAAPLDTSLPSSLRKVSMTLELQPDPDKVWNSFSSKHRTAIRRSYKNDLEVYSGGMELVPTFYETMRQSWRSLGTPLYARSYFERIMATFGDHVRIFVCHRKQEPVAVALNGYANRTVEGMWAGGGSLARTLQANYVLYWEMIKDGCLRGYDKYHLGRSTVDSGSEDFKKKWNAQVTQLYWYFHRPDGGPMPELNVDNPKFKLAIAAWRRLPAWITDIVGPSLAKSIP